jgi:hypothetical protein
MHADKRGWRVPVHLAGCGGAKEKELLKARAGGLCLYSRDFQSPGE